MKKLLAPLLFLALALAQEGPVLSGDLTYAVGLRYSDLRISQNQAGFSLKLKAETETAALVAELEGGPAGLGLGEAYARLYLGPVDLTAGRIVVSTGRTDLFSPLDAFNPKNLARPLAEPEDQKVPLEGVSLVYYPEDTDAELELLYAPVFVPSTPPAGDWARPFSLPPGVVKVETARPDPKLENGVFGLRASTSLALLDGLDLGATLLYTYTPFPGLKALLDANNPSQPCLDPNAGPCVAVLGYDRLALLGGDLALAFQVPGVEGGFVARAEAAYGRTADTGGTDPFVQDSYLEGVLELEHTFPDGPTVLLLYQTRYAAASGFTAHHLAVTARHEASEDLTLEGAWVHNLTDGSGALLPRLRYQLAGGVSAALRLAVFYGGANTEFGAWRELGELGAELRYAF